MITAPFDGIVTNVDSLQVGAYLQPPQSGFSQVSSERLWVTASPKETELTNIQVGQGVTIEVDTYPGVIWHGTVDSISPASSASFSLLPAQNTTGNAMKRWWFKHQKGNAAAPTLAPTPEGFLLPQPSESLLCADHRKKLLERIWQYTALSESQFDQLYLDPIRRYADYVQQLPASESHHHAYAGGMLDHGLELVACSLKLRQSSLVPSGAAPEDQAAQADAWSAAIAYGALLHDIGKIAVDLQVEYQNGEVWPPWHGPLDRALPLSLRGRPRLQAARRRYGAAVHASFDIPST